MKRVGALALCALLASPAQALQNTPEESVYVLLSRYMKIREFDVDRIGKVALSQKNLYVHIKIAPGAEDFNAISETFEVVRQFYSRRKINIVYSSQELEPAYDKINIMILPQEQYDLLFPPERNEKYDPNQHMNTLHPQPEFFYSAGTAQIEGRDVYIRFRDADHDMRYRDLVTRHYANTLKHEIGHMLGLYHTDDVTDDSITDHIGDAHNVMYPGSPSFFADDYIEFTPLQDKLIHSFMEKGKVWKLLGGKYMNFSHYVENVKLATNLRAQIDRRTKGY